MFHSCCGLVGVVLSLEKEVFIYDTFKIIVPVGTYPFLDKLTYKYIH